MKSNLLLICICSLFVFGCAAGGAMMYGTPRSNGHGYAVSHEAINSRNGSVSIEYKSKEFLVREKTKELNNRLVDASTKERELNLIPEGGYIVVKIRRLSIEAANPDNFEYVVKDGDKEIYRGNGKSKVADWDRFYKNIWWSIDLFLLDHPIQSSVTVYVIDKVLGGRDQFSISVPHNRS